MKEDKLKFPLKDTAYSDADVAIDLDSLGITNNKRVKAVSLFADVDGGSVPNSVEKLIAHFGSVPNSVEKLIAHFA